MPFPFTMAFAATVAPGDVTAKGYVNLRGMWDMEEFSGTSLIDVSTNNSNDGTITGAVQIDGAIDNALDFGLDTDDFFVSVPNHSSIDITGAMSVSFWFRSPGGAADDQGLVSKYDSIGVNERAWSVDIPFGTSQIRFRVSPDGTFASRKDLTTVASTYTDNEWYHVVCVFDPSTLMAIYVNGVLETSSASGVPASIHSTVEELVFGKRESNASTEMEGGLDDIRLFAEALDAIQIADLYAERDSQITNADHSNLYVLNDMEQISGTTAIDASNQGNDGTIVNSPSTTTGAVGDTALTLTGTEFIRYGDILDTFITGNVTRFSGSVWIKTTDTGVRGLIAKGTTTSGEYQFTFQKLNDQLRFLWYTSVTATGFRAASTGASLGIQDDAWHHVAFSYDIDTGTQTTADEAVTIWVDGVEVAVTETLASGAYAGIADGPGQLALGAQVNNGGTAQATSQFIGDVDQFRFLNRKFNQAEVTALFMEGAPAIVSDDHPYLLAYFSYDKEGGGGAFVVDDSNNGNNALYRGNAAIGVAGQVNNALTLDGTGDYTEVESARAPGSDAMSFSCIFKIDVVPGGSATLCSWGLPSGSNFHDILRCFNDNKVYIVTDDGASGFVGSSNTYSTGVWHHIVAVWDGSNHTIYLDGVKTTSANKTSAIATSGNFFVGCRGNQGPGSPDAFFDGLIDEGRWYGKALSDAEAAVIRNLDMGL